MLYTIGSALSGKGQSTEKDKGVQDCVQDYTLRK